MPDNPGGERCRHCGMSLGQHLAISVSAGDGTERYVKQACRKPPRPATFYDPTPPPDPEVDLSDEVLDHVAMDACWCEAGCENHEHTTWDGCRRESILKRLKYVRDAARREVKP